MERQVKLSPADISTTFVGGHWPTQAGGLAGLAAVITAWITLVKLLKM